jgi:hypothetical protein
MTPPPALFHDAHRGSRAHLSLWEIRGNYTSAVDCEKALTKMQNEMLHKEQDDLETAARADANLDDRANYAYEAAHLARCLSADDPGLKKK